MFTATEELSALRRQIESMRSLPLLALDEFVEYTHLCERVLAMATYVGAHAEAVADPVETGKDLYDLGLVLRRSGDGLASTEVFECAGRFAEARNDRKRAASAFNSAAITLYQLGIYPRSYEMLDRALVALDNDDFGMVRATGILMNRANVLHYERRFAEAEVAYLELIARIERLSPDLFARHSTFGYDELCGMLRVNLAGNRCLWAQADAESGLPISSHISVTKEHLREGLARPIRPMARVTGECLEAHVAILEGQADRAKRLLSRISEQCAREPDLLPLLPQVYRYEAEACVALGDAPRALVHCNRALETSLAVANDLEERTVVDTFVDLLRLTSRCLFEPSDPPHVKAQRYSAQAIGLVESLVDVVERKDWYLGNGHARSVATVAKRLAGVLASREDETGARARTEIDDHALGLAGLLHDIGKLALPWSLLNKIVPLSAWEVELLHSHPTRGEAILRDGGLPEVGAITAEHHETPRGTGYPSGRTRISLMGSILAVAEVFAGMTTPNRRDRDAVSVHETVRTIIDGGGTQYDPLVVDALVTLVLHEA